MNKIALFVLMCSLPLLGACSDTTDNAREGQAGPRFGAAVNGDIAAQTVNPGAPESNAPIRTNGQRAALAQDRYTQGKVIVPDDIDVSMNNSGGSGGSSGSGGGSSGTPAQ